MRRHHTSVQRATEQFFEIFHERQSYPALIPIAAAGIEISLSKASVFCRSFGKTGKNEESLLFHHLEGDGKEREAAQLYSHAAARLPGDERVIEADLSRAVSNLECPTGDCVRFGEGLPLSIHSDVI